MNSAGLVLPGHVFWITGYSGAGKTTVGQALRHLCWSTGMHPLLLDGDVLRSIFGRRHGYSEEDRRELASSYSYLCAELSSQGADVICTTISMFDDIRTWNRQNIPRYHEIYLKVPLAERRSRDPKGLYRAAGDTSAEPMAGLHLRLDEPKDPDLIIENFGALTARDTAERIWTYFVERQNT